MITLEERTKKMKKQIWESFFSSILLIVFALILLFKSEDIVSNIILGLGLLSIFLAGIHFIQYLRMEKEFRVYSNDILESVVLLLLGIIALCKNTVLADMVTYVLGAYLIYKNAYRIQICFHLSEIQKEVTWKYFSLVSVFGVIMGAFIILNPLEGKLAISSVIAYSIFISEILNILQNVALLIGLGKKNETKSDS